MFLLHLTHDTKFFYEIDIDVTCAKYDRAFYQKTTLSFEKKHCVYLFLTRRFDGSVLDRSI